MVLPVRDENPATRPPVVTLTLIAINVVVFIFVQPHGGGSPESAADEQLFLYRHAAIPCELQTGEPLDLAEIRGDSCDAAVPVFDPNGVDLGDVEIAPDKNVYLAVLWSLFLHASIVHLLGNMLFLWIFGNNVEDRLGSLAFLAFYLAAGALATAGHVAGNLPSVAPLIGASGAIAGVMGAYLVWFPNARILSLVGFFPIYLPAFVVLGLWFVLQFATDPNEGVAWLAHVGGFATGVVVGFALRDRFPPRPRQRFVES